MGIFKRLWLPSAIFGIAVLFLLSCDDDSYSYEFRLSYGVVEKPSMGHYTINLDNGKILYPSFSNISSDQLENQMRLLVDYTILEDADPSRGFDYYVRLNGAREILTKELVPYSLSVSDSLGLDPIELEEPWIANGFITFDFLYAGNGLIKHMVNLVLLDEKTSDGRTLLEFRHNAYTDPGNYAIQGTVSFRLANTFPEATDPIPLRIRYKAFDKEAYFDLTYTPDNK